MVFPLKISVVGFISHFFQDFNFSYLRMKLENIYIYILLVNLKN